MKNIYSFGSLYAKCFALYALAILCAVTSPVVKAQTNQTVANGAMTQPINFPTANCTYTWTNNNTAIGLQATNTGNIAPFKAVNTGIAPVEATITATIPATTLYNYRYTATGIALLDPITLNQIKEIPTATRETELKAANPDGTIFYLVDNKNAPNVIKLVSSLTTQEVGTITVSRPLSSLIQSRDGSKIYSYEPTADNKSGVISVIDVAGRTEETPIIIPANLLTSSSTAVAPAFTLSKDGTKLYMLQDKGNNAGILAVIDLASRTVTSSVNVARPNGIIESNDATKLYAYSASHSQVYIYDLVSGTVNTVKASKQAHGIALSKDGNKLYIMGVFNVDILDLSTGVMSDLNHGQSGQSWLGMRTNADRSRIYITEQHTGNVMVIDADDGTLRNMIKTDMAKTLGVTDAAESAFTFNGDDTRIFVSATVTDLTDGTESYWTATIDLTTNLMTEKKKVTAIPPRTFSYRVSKACTASTITVKITVQPDPPTITPSNNTLAAHSTTYGMPSTAATFTVSGQRINAGILVTPPAGFEVSTSGTTFTNTLTVGGSGDVAATTVYIRLKATTNVGNAYGGNIVISNGNLSLNKAIPASTVTQATLTLAATNVTKKYGEVLTGGPGSTAFNPTGLKNNETIGSVTVTYGIGAAARDAVKSHAGSVKIDLPTGGTFLASNYQISRSDADIIVEQATLTVTADDKQRYYNEADPVFTFKYSGFVSPDDESVLTSIPTVSTTAAKASPVGKYPINITGGAALNYKIEGKAGTLTIISRSVVPATAFTPNGDGINDTWNIANINQYPKATVQVYTRSGSQVFYALGYHTPWDARSNSGILPSGTYYYVIDLGNGTDPMKGSLLIIR